jgi:hypothetical protein
MVVRLLSITVLCSIVVTLGTLQPAIADQGTQDHRAPACRPKGAGCVGDAAGNGDNKLCCSDRCNWVNEKQAYLCD